VGFRESGEGRLRVQGLGLGPGDWRAGPVAGWGCPACAARCSGRRDPAPAVLKPCPPQPPRGAEHPHPTPPARPSALPHYRSFHEQVFLQLPGPHPLPLQHRSAAAQRQLEVEQAPAASKSSVQPAAQAASRRPQGAPAPLETTGSGHASTPKPRSRKCLPKSSRDGRRGAPGQNTQARLRPRVLTRGTPPSKPTSISVSNPPPPGRVNPCPTPTH
jgi:type IV secretory pathway VirB10-like protein